VDRKNKEVLEDKDRKNKEADRKNKEVLEDREVDREADREADKEVLEGK
jgi:hypothetical protein